MVVYKSVFGSQLVGKQRLAAPMSDKLVTVDNNNNNNTINRNAPWQALLERSSSLSEPWTRGSVERQPDGSVVLTRSRVFQNKRMIRQETMWTDRATGQRHSTVTVTSEPCESATEKEETVSKLNQQGPCMCVEWDVVMPRCTLEAVLCGDMLCGDHAWFVPTDQHDC